MTIRKITDLAIEHRLPYRVAYDKALRGDFGQVRREGGRLIVVVGEPETQPASAA